MPLLEIKNLYFSYNQSDVLHDINLELNKAQIWAFVGPNGSGKSTLLRCLCGLLKPQKGEILYEGNNLKHLNRKKIARNICFLPQNHFPVQYLSVRELVAMGRSPYQMLGWMLGDTDKQKVDWALDYMNLTHLIHRPVESLSGGERQRAWIAMILAQDTKVVLLDEPVTFLDLKYQWDLIEKIQDIRDKLQKSFVIVLHDINHAMALADNVLVLKEGRVHCSGKPAGVITPQLLHDVYEIEASVYTLDKHPRPVIVPQATYH